MRLLLGEETAQDVTRGSNRPIRDWRRTLLALLLSAVLFSFIAVGADAKITRVFIVPLSHLDIGFTATPQEVAAHFQKDVELALRLVNNLPDARWNIETFWQLEQWLKAHADTPHFSLLENAWATGRLGISAAYASMHSSLMTGEEMLRMLYPAQELSRKIGSPLTTAVMNDVPGFAWYVPQALNASGIKRLILGTNLQFDGGASISPRDLPFYWVGPDGSSVLTWVSREAYLEGSFYWELHNPEKFQSRLKDFERSGYPYDAILIIDGYGDNAGVDSMLSKLNAIRRLQFELDDVEILYSTIDEFFDYMEDKYGDEFPTLSGDWGRSWEVSRLGGTWQMAEYRALQRLVPAAESLSTIAWLKAGLPYPAEKLSSAWGLLVLLGEHSAGPSTGWDDLVTAQQVDETNRTVLSYVISARQIVDEVLDSAFSSLAGKSGAEDIWVYNPLSWPRKTIVALPLQDLVPAESYRVIDPASGQELPSVVVDDELLFETALLPSMGMTRYRVDTVSQGMSASSPAGQASAPLLVTTGNLLLENEWHRIAIDPQAGWIVEWHDKESGRQIVNPASPYRFNQLLTASHHTDFIGGTPTPLRPEVASFEAIDSPLYTGVRVNYASGTPWHATEILLPRAGKAVEIHNVLDRSQMRYVPYGQHSDHYYFAFPLTLSPRQLDVRYQGATRFQSLAHDTLRGGNANGIISLGAIDLRDDEWGVTVAHREAFAFSVGGIGHSSALFLPREATLIAHVVQKADEGKTKDQGVTTFDLEPGAPDLLRFSFSLTTSDGEFDAVAATRKALEWTTPALAWATAAQALAMNDNATDTNVTDADALASGGSNAGGETLLGQSMFSVDQPNVIVTALKRAELNRAPEGSGLGETDQSDLQHREIVVRLQEVAGISSTVRLETPFTVLSAIRTQATEYELTDSAEAEVRLDHLELGPYETLTLKLRLAD